MTRGRPQQGPTRNNERAGSQKTDGSSRRPLPAGRLLCPARAFFLTHQRGGIILGELIAEDKHSLESLLRDALPFSSMRENDTTSLAQPGIPRALAVRGGSTLSGFFPVPKDSDKTRRSLQMPTYQTELTLHNMLYKITTIFVESIPRKGYASPVWSVRSTTWLLMVARVRFEHERPATTFHSNKKVTAASCCVGEPASTRGPFYRCVFIIYLSNLH